MRAVVYARVSSAQQRDRDTIASQLRVLPDFVARMGWELARPADTYVDDGRTAKAGHLEARLGLAALLRDAALRLFDVVVVVDVDRITRSEDLAERGAILGALQRAGVKVASAASGQVLDLSTSTGDLFTTLHAFFAAEWTRKHRERVVQGKITAIQRGRKPAGSGPWWLRCDKTTGAWSIDPVRGPLIRELFERVAAGESCRAVSDDFHRRGVPRPRGEWNRSRAQRIVRQRTAIGEWTIDRKRGLVIQVPPIIDEDLWQRAQASMDASGRRGLRRTRHDYLLEGLAVCGACGAPIHIRTQVWDARRNGRHDPAAYICRARRNFRTGGPRCEAPILYVADVDTRAWAAIRRELEDPGLADAVARELAGQADEHDRWRADADGYRAQLGRLDQVETALLERFSRGLVTEAGLDRQLEELRRRRDSLRSQLATAERAQTATEGVRERLDDAMRTLETLRGTLAAADFATRRWLVDRLVPRGGVVFAGRSLRITLLVPRGSARGHRPDLAERSACSTPHETHLKIRVVA